MKIPVYDAGQKCDGVFVEVTGTTNLGLDDWNIVYHVGDLCADFTRAARRIFGDGVERAVAVVRANQLIAPIDDDLAATKHSLTTTEYLDLHAAYAGFLSTAKALANSGITAEDLAARLNSRPCESVCVKFETGYELGLVDTLGLVNTPTYNVSISAPSHKCSV